MGRLINLTMQEARPLAELAQDVFDTCDARAEQALTALIALGCMARPGFRRTRLASVSHPYVLPRSAGIVGLS